MSKLSLCNYIYIAPYALDICILSAVIFVKRKIILFPFYMLLWFSCFSLDELCAAQHNYLDNVWIILNNSSFVLVYFFKL